MHTYPEHILCKVHMIYDSSEYFSIYIRQRVLGVETQQSGSSSPTSQLKHWLEKSAIAEQV